LASQILPLLFGRLTEHRRIITNSKIFVNLYSKEKAHEKKTVELINFIKFDIFEYNVLKLNSELVSF